MRRRIKAMALKRLSLRESWGIFFILGVVMLNYPFLEIFNKPVRVGGLPLLYLYLQVGWLASLLVVYLFGLAQERKKDDERRS